MRKPCFNITTITTIFILSILFSPLSFADNVSHKAKNKPDHHKTSKRHHKGHHKVAVVKTKEVNPQPKTLKDIFKLTTKAILTTNFIFRGFSISDDDAAVQGFWEISTIYGFYANMEASNVRFPVKDGQMTRILLLPSIGFRKKIHDFRFNIAVDEYGYPGVHRTNWNEVYGSVGYKYFTVGVNYTANFLRNGFKYLYYYGKFTYPLPFKHRLLQNMTFDATVARSDFSGPLRNADFTYWDIGLSKKLFKHYIARISYTDTNANESIIRFSRYHIVGTIIAIVG